MLELPRQQAAAAVGEHRLEKPVSDPDLFDHRCGDGLLQDWWLRRVEPSLPLGSILGRRPDGELDLLRGGALPGRLRRGLGREDRVPDHDDDRGDQDGE